jgi:hypothetical protein
MDTTNRATLTQLLGKVFPQLGGRRNQSVGPLLLRRFLTALIGARVGDEVLQATTGSYVFKPRGLPRTFWNAPTKPARLLELISPAGFEKYFAELAGLLRTGGSVDQITNLAEKYGLKLRMDWVPELCAKFKLKLVGE